MIRSWEQSHDISHCHMTKIHKRRHIPSSLVGGAEVNPVSSTIATTSCTGTFLAISSSCCKSVTALFWSFNSEASLARSSLTRLDNHQIINILVTLQSHVTKIPKSCDYNSCDLTSHDFLVELIFLLFSLLKLILQFSNLLLTLF